MEERKRKEKEVGSQVVSVEIHVLMENKKIEKFGEMRSLFFLIYFLNWADFYRRP